MSRIAIIGKNSIGYISSLIDIWNEGNCAVLIDYRIPIDTAIIMMIEANVTKCYISKDIYDTVDLNYARSIQFVAFDTINETAEKLPKHIYGEFKHNYTNSEAVIIYSSGTTGKAKGIILSHYAINSNADSIIEYMSPNVDDCIYIAKNISHSSTLVGELLVALKSKMNLIIAPTVVPPRVILNNLKRFNVTLMCLNPTILNLIADEYEKKKYDISSLKRIYVSGSILTDKMYNKVHRIFKNLPIYNVYGLSEAGPRVTAQRAGCCSSNSVGKEISKTKIIVVNEDGEQVGINQKGIIHVKTQSVFNGYVYGEEKNQSLYYDWLNTGDVGYIDENGELHIVNRIDDIISINSQKVNPKDVESYILEDPDINECMVIKIFHNQKDVMCCLYSGKEIDYWYTVNRLKKRLLLYEIPQYFIKTDVMPCNNNGKYSKNEAERIIKKELNV